METRYKARWTFALSFPIYLWYFFWQTGSTFQLYKLSSCFKGELHCPKHLCHGSASVVCGERREKNKLETPKVQHLHPRQDRACSWPVVLLSSGCHHPAAGWGRARCALQKQVNCRGGCNERSSHQEGTKGLYLCLPTASCPWLVVKDQKWRISTVVLIFCPSEHQIILEIF